MKTWRQLTPDKLPQAAEWIHELRERSDKEKQNAFDLAFGCLSAEEGEAFAKAVEECERIDEEIWEIAHRYKCIDWVYAW